MGVTVRWLLVIESSKVAALDAELFELPWTKEQFIDFQTAPDNYILAAFYRQQLVGYTCFTKYRRRLDIVRMCVDDSNVLEDTVITAMLAAVKSTLPKNNRIRVCVEIDAEQTDFQILLKSLGFCAEAWLCGKYDHPERHSRLFCYRPSRHKLTKLNIAAIDAVLGTTDTNDLVEPR